MSVEGISKNYERVSMASARRRSSLLAGEKKGEERESGSPQEPNRHSSSSELVLMLVDVKAAIRKTQDQREFC